MLRNIQDDQFGRRGGVDLGRPDFCALAGSLGLAWARVGAADGFGKLGREALASRAPFLLEVDMEAIGPIRNPYTGTSKRPKP